MINTRIFCNESCTCTPYHDMFTNARSCWHLKPLSMSFVILMYKYNDVCNWPFDSPLSCSGLHDLRIAFLNTYYNMTAISLHYNITDLTYYLLGDGDSNLLRHDWQVNTIDGPTKLVHQDAILGGVSMGQLRLLRL